MDFYNNPAKPCTPPLILLWDIYWLFKKILLTVWTNLIKRKSNQFLVRFQSAKLKRWNPSPACTGSTSPAITSWLYAGFIVQGNLWAHFKTRTSSSQGDAGKIILLFTVLLLWLRRMRLIRSMKSRNKSSDYDSVSKPLVKRLKWSRANQVNSLYSLRGLLNSIVHCGAILKSIFFWLKISKELPKRTLETEVRPLSNPLKITPTLLV